MPPLRFKRTVLITGGVSLIRLAFGQPPTPFGLPLKGKARAGEDTRPYGTYKRLPGNAVGADDLGGPRAHTVRPYSGKRGGSIGSANLGAGVKPHQPQF